jgi:signal transduction histidine kinase/ActR/RegA family two-component response regulator
MKNTCNIKNVLLVNRNTKDNQVLEEAIRHYCPDINIMKGQSVKRACDLIRKKSVDTVFIDYAHSKEDIDFFKELKRTDALVHVIALVEEGKELQAAEAIKDGAYDYLIKRADSKKSIPAIIKKIQGLSILKREKEETLEQQSYLFKQIFRSQKWWQNIIDSITDYMFVIDEQHRILRTNKAFANLFDKEPADIIMKPYYELYGLNAPHTWCVLPKNKDSFSSNSIEEEINSTVYLISYFPIFFDGHEAVVYILKDVTETRRLKDQIYHLDKLSSLGTLTSGVAHEINNPLTGIIGYTEMLLQDEGDDKTRKYMQKVYDSAIRCKRIVENMLTFSRQTPALKSPENINDIIDKTIELHEYWLRNTNIEVVKNYDNVPYISIDRQQTQQVIMNLLINAEHAIADTDRNGRIEFATHYDKNDKTVTITISDNGKGIPLEVLPKIFDPFFTTKPVNKGTGLGLSITHGIIAELGGTIEVKSEKDKGTSFIIKLLHSD